MKKPSQQNLDRIEEAAANWLVRLVESSNDEALRREFEAWCEQDPLHAEIATRTKRAYDLIGIAASDRTAPRSHLSPQSNAPVRPPQANWRRGSRRSTRRPARRLVAALALCALAVLLTATLFPDLVSRAQGQIATATARIEIVNLSDGSVVSLAPESALEVRFSELGRQVELIRGQAFFKVAPDPRRPFKVLAAGTTVTVLSTAFEVRVMDGLQRVAVEHGKVRVATGRSATTSDMRAGDWLLAAATGIVDKGRSPADEVAAWRNGQLIARNMSLDSVVQGLQRFHVGAILVTSDRFASRRVTGVYDLRTPEDTLRSLAELHGAVIHRVSPWLLLVMDR